MGRLRSELLNRVEAFSHRVLDIVGMLDEQGISRRIVDQLAASGTSIGANLYEADEAMSRKDFVKCLAIANKEMSETRYWLRLVVHRKWVAQVAGEPLLNEGLELQKIIGTMIVRSRTPSPYRKPDAD
jgi:four helix bundle protein